MHNFKCHFALQQLPFKLTFCIIDWICASISTYWTPVVSHWKRAYIDSRHYQHLHNFHFALILLSNLNMYSFIFWNDNRRSGTNIIYTKKHIFWGGGEYKDWMIFLLKVYWNAACYVNEPEPSVFRWQDACSRHQEHFSFLPTVLKLWWRRPSSRPLSPD